MPRAAASSSGALPRPHQSLHRTMRRRLDASLRRGSSVAAFRSFSAADRCDFTRSRAVRGSGTSGARTLGRTAHPLGPRRLARTGRPRAGARDGRRYRAVRSEGTMDSGSGLEHPRRAEQVMLRHVITALPDMTLLDADALIRSARLRHLLVVRSEILVGVLSYRPSDGSVDRAADDRGAFRRDWSSVRDPRSRCDLRNGVSAVGRSSGHLSDLEPRQYLLHGAFDEA